MIDSKILQRALDWNKYPKGIRIFLDTEVSSIQNTEVRDAILLDEKKQALAPKFYRGKKRKTWYDSSSNAIHVILSNIESPRELDRVILNEVLLRRGLAGLVGDDVMNRIANAVFDGQDEQTRKTFLSYVLGNNDMETDRIAAGKLYLRSQANQYAKAVTSQSKENAGKAWYSMVHKYIRPYASQLFSFLSEETSLPHIIGAGIRAHAFYDSYSAKMSEVSSSRVRDEIVKLYNRELEGRTLDLGRYIHLGRPGDILLASAPWTKTCPVILPLVSLYENMEDGRHERYITSVEDIKKEKHPFSLLQVLNLRDELESPLAVFKSVKRDRGLVFMLPSKGGKTADASKMEHFAVPISLQEINYTENSGLRKSYGSGKWVNYIHSIYPKNDSGYLCWLSVPGLCSYLSPSFEEKWLKPAETRLEERFEHMFKAEGIKKPSAGEIKEILNNLSADDYIDIKSKLAKFQDLNEAGLPKVYSVYRDVLESATKIVKEFENPKIISQKNVEFSIQDEDLSPIMMLEKVLDKLLEDNPEKLRRIAYLCVKGSPAFSNELPPVNPVSYVADMQYGELKETIMEHWPKLSEDARTSIHAEFPELPNLSLDENTKYEDARKLFFTLTLDDKCRFMGYDGKNDAWKDLMNWHPLGGPDWKLDEDMLSGGIDDMFKQSTAEEVIEKYIEWKNDSFKASETYALAKDITMFMVNKLNEHGIKTVMVPEEEAHEILEKERGPAGEGLERIDFSVRDIMNLSYSWNGEEVSMRGFAEQFMSEIKQKDRTMEDAERIAKAFIEAVKTDPEKVGMKMLKAENMANAFRFKLPDGTIYTPEHPLASSPEYETQRGLWLIYENVLGRETMNEFVGLLSKKAPMSAEERKRYSKLESKVNGSDLMQRSLEVPASKVNENRVRDIRNLIQYFEGNEDYTWTEKALIVKGAMSFGYSEKKESDQTKVEIKNISDNNSVAVPVIGGEAAAVVEGLRKGLDFKDALIQARISLSKESKRSVERNFTGWKVYKQSDKEEDAVILNQDVAGTGWCTGGAVSTARSHLSGGDFHVYYEAGEPLIAIRTQDGCMAEPPRGAHEGQFCTSREEQIAFDYIKSGNGIIAGDDYIADIEDIRRIMSPDATPLDAFLLPESRRYENGEYGDTSAWGETVERRIAELVPNDIKARQNLGLYYGDEIEEACRNGYVKAIKGEICLTGSASLTLPEGVTQVGKIWLYDSSSLTILKSVTQVGDIELHGSTSLTLPEGVTQVGKIWLYGTTSLTLPDGLTQVGDIWLYDSSSLTLPEGVTQVVGINLCDNSSLTLPAGVTHVGDIELHGSTSLTLPEGMTQAGGIRIYDSSSLTLPEGLTQVGDIVLGNKASLTILKGVTQVGDIELHGSTSLTIPEGVAQVGNIWLYGTTSLTLPDGLTQVGDIWLYGTTSLTLPEGVTQVGNIVLGNKASLTILKGVTQVEGNVRLAPGASITFPDGFALRNESSDRMHYSAEKINEILSEHQKKTEFRLSNGTIYGYQIGETIYLTPKGVNPNTPIHEYAHLWAKVYEKLRPDEWESLKEELKTLPQWQEIAESESYSFIESDENRLAGEVLATIVGNKGEELMLTAARDTLKEGERTDGSVVKGAEYFRRKVTDMAVKDVFDAEGLERTGEVTLKVLKDFAEGKGVKISKEEGEKLAAHAEYIPEESFINNIRQSHNSTLRTSQPGEDAPRFVKYGANVRTISELSKYTDSLIEQIQNGRQLNGGDFLYEICLALGFPENALKGNVSLYFKVNELDSLRIANHYGNAEFFKMHKHPNDNYGIVIKLSNSRFIKDSGVEYREYVYFPDLLTPKKQIDILNGLREYVSSGDFSLLPKPDKENLSQQINFQIETNKVIQMKNISTWFSELSFEDKIRVFGFYHFTPGVEGSPIGLLENNDDVKILNKTYESAIGVPMDVPEVDESVVRASIEKMLVSAFDSLSDASMAQIYRDVVASGIPVNTLKEEIEILQNFKNEDDVLIRKDGNYTLPEGVTQVGDIELSGSASLTLPEGVTQVGNIRLRDNASLTIPEGVTQVGDIKLSGFGSTSLTLPKGLTQVGNIRLRDNASLTIPEGVTQVGYIELSGFGPTSLTLPKGLTQMGDIVLFSSASLTVPEGVTQVGYIELSGFGSNSLTLPESVTQVGYIRLSGSSSLTLPKGVTRVESVELRDSASLSLPKGVTQVGSIQLEGPVSLTLPEGVTQVGNIWLRVNASLTIPEGVTQVADIELDDNTSLTLPEGLTQVRDIVLRDSTSLALPEGVTQMGDIKLFDSTSLTLPEGVTQVGDIELSSTHSLTLPESVTQVGIIRLYGSTSLTLPESVTQVGGIELYDSASLTLPEGVTQVVGINLYDSASLTLPEGVTLVGNIRLSGSSSLILPEGVTQVGNIRLSSFSSLTLPEGVKQVGNIWLHDNSSLTLPEGVTQVGSIHLSSGTSITFPDGFVLRNESSNRMLYSAEKINEILSEHQKKGAEYFRRKVTDMAVKDVFDAEGMERTGEVTLKVLKDFAEGKGVKVSKEEGKKLAAMAEFERNRVKTTEYISKSNARFNEELQKQIDGEFDSEPHTYNLGYPGPILRSTGIPNLPIQVTSTKLYEKSNSDKHKYALDEIKDLVKHINTPVAVFIYGDGTLAQNIIVDIEHDNSHFLVGMSLNAHIKGSALEINSIRNVFPKDNYKWMEWIQEGKSRYMDKEKIKVLIAQQRTSPADVNHLDLDFVANIVEKFENPKVDEKYFIIDNWQYYGVFLDDRAQSIIDREFRELIPSGWRKHADHVTVLYNDYSNDLIAKGRSLAKTLGQERTMRIVALGKSDTAIALMVEGVETENKIAHITLATSPDGKPVDSNFITEWKPVEQIDISGRLGLSYKGKKYFEVLSDNDVVDFQINKNNMAKQVQQQSPEKKDATVAISDLVKDADFKTLQKAALFAAWETREDNPYEFVVDMSRNELAEFLANAEKKLNDEDRDIVSKILSHEPGYGEDYVEKQISFRPDIETLLVDDLTVGGDVLDRALFYLATKDMNDAQLQQLRDNVRKKAVDFYSNMDKKNALPGHKDAEKFVDKQLHSWFRPWTRLAGKLEHQLDEIHMSDSDPVSLKDIEATARDAMTDPAYANYINRELKGWIRNRCADYGLDYTKLPEDLQYEGAAETYRQMFPEYVKDTKIDTLTRDAILAHIDKITALYPQYPQEPTKVSLKPDGSIVRQYGEFEYEQIKGGFECSKNLVLVEELDGETLQRKALYYMSSDSYGEHPNGPYVRFWDNGNIRSYENCFVRVGSDNEFESDMLSFTREGIVQEKIPGDYPIDFFLEDITNEYMKTMTQRQGLEPNATANNIAFPESEELKALAKECAARKSFLNGFDYDISVLNTEKMSDSELYSFVSKNLSVLSIEQLTEAQRMLKKWRNFNDMMQKNDAIDKRFSKYFAPHCEAVLERTGLDLNELHQSLPQKEFARLMRGQEVLIDGTVNTKEGPSNGLWSFRISPAKPGPDNPGFSFYLYPVKYHDGPNGKIPEHKMLPKGEDLVIKGRHFKAGSDEVEQWRLAGRGIVLETTSGLELVTPGKYDSTVGIARSVSYIEKRLTSLEHADLHLRPFKDDGSIKKEKTKGFQIGGDDIPKLARGEEVILTTKDGVKACVRYDCGENNLIEVVPFAIAKRMELRDELKQKDKANLEKVIKEVGRPSSKELDNNIRKK